VGGCIVRSMRGLPRSEIAAPAFMAQLPLID
jgi:hypothetical protein